MLSSLLRELAASVGNRLKPGDRITITNRGHPWAGRTGQLLAFELYPGTKWWGWRIRLDFPCGHECYAKAEELMRAV